MEQEGKTLALFGNNIAAAFWLGKWRYRAPRKKGGLSFVAAGSTKRLSCLTSASQSRLGFCSRIVSRTRSPVQMTSSVRIIIRARAKANLPWFLPRSILP
jgi:hypothetical protein